MKLVLPIREYCAGDYYEEGSPHPLVFIKMSQERYCLDSLTETHLICKNTVDALLIEVIQPSETLKLILLQMTEEALRWIDDRGVCSIWIIKFVYLKLIISDFL